MACYTCGDNSSSVTPPIYDGNGSGSGSGSGEATGPYDIFNGSPNCKICFRCLSFWIFLAVAALLIFRGRN